MKFNYVGLKKDGETAFAELTGIPVWMPGDQFDIASPGAAARMRQHPDVWELVVENAAAPPPPSPAAPTSAVPGLTPHSIIGPQSVIPSGPGSSGDVDEELEVTTIRTPKGDITLDGMTREALKALAADLGVSVHHAAGIPKITAALVEAFPPADEPEEVADAPADKPATDTPAPEA